MRAYSIDSRQSIVQAYEQGQGSQRQLARLQYLPPYSPDFSPIEPCWSKLKAFLRAQAARTREALDTALPEGLKLITPQDAHGGFTYCGYRGTPN